VYMLEGLGSSAFNTFTSSSTNYQECFPTFFFALFCFPPPQICKLLFFVE
jgi:hypothetical protein